MVVRLGLGETGVARAGLSSRVPGATRVSGRIPPVGRTSDEALLLVLRHLKLKTTNPNAALPAQDWTKAFIGYKALYAAALAFALSQLQERYGGDKQQATEELDRLISEGRAKLGQAPEPWVWERG
jgi:hypothetical protein